MLTLLTTLETFVQRAVGEVDTSDEKKSLYTYLPKIEERVDADAAAMYKVFSTYIFLQVLGLKELINEDFKTSVWKKNRALVVVRDSKAINQLVHVLLSVCWDYTGTLFSILISLYILKVLITSNLPLWWAKDAKYCFDTAIHIDVKQVEYANEQLISKQSRKLRNEKTKFPYLKATVLPGVDALFDTVYFVPPADINWQSSVAYDKYLIMHITTVTHEMPWILWVLFDDTKLKEGVKVFLKDREPVSEDFATVSGVYQEVGPGKKFAVSLILPKDRKNVTYRIFLSVKPVKVNIQHTSTFSKTTFIREGSRTNKTILGAANTLM